jgi:hypothetical protein
MWGSGEMASLFLNFNTWWGQRSTLRCDHCTLGIQLKARLGGFQTGHGQLGVAKNPFPQPRI